MIKKLCERGYAKKEKSEAVHLTALGKQLAENHSKQYALLYEKIECSLGLTQGAAMRLRYFGADALL